MLAVLPLAAAATVAGLIPAANALEGDTGTTTSEPSVLRVPRGVKTTGPRSVSAAQEPVATPTLPKAETPAAMARAKRWDVNGDTYADLVVGAPSETLGSAVDAGGFHVLYGGASTVTATGSKFYSQDTTGVPGAAETDDWMGDITASDDFNADGYADVAVAVGGENGNGRVYVFPGSATGLDTSKVVVLQNQTMDAGWFGWDLAAGDINADGYGDLLASDPDFGEVKVFTGDATGLAQDRSASWNAGTVEGGYGMTIEVGDLNGDGVDDAAISEPYADPMAKGYPTGQVWIWYGNAAISNQTWHKDSTDILGAPTPPGTNYEPDTFGYSLAIGDYNADGYADLAASAPFARVSYTSSTGSTVYAQDAGTINVIYGSASGLTATGNEHISQATAGVPGTPGTKDYFGLTLAAGDANGDNDAELAAFSSREDMVVVMNGSNPDGIAPVSAMTFTQDTSGIPGSKEAEDEFGASLRFADFIGGSYADLAIGAPGENSWAGNVTVLKATSSGLSGTGAVAYSQDHSAIPGTSETDDWFGSFF